MFQLDDTYDAPESDNLDCLPAWKKYKISGKSHKNVQKSKFLVPNSRWAWHLCAPDLKPRKTNTLLLISTVNTKSTEK